MNIRTSVQALVVAAAIAASAPLAQAHDYYLGGAPEDGGELLFFESLGPDDGVPVAGSYRVVRVPAGETVPIAVRDGGDCKADVQAEVTAGKGIVSLKNARSSGPTVSHTFQVSGDGNGVAVVTVSVRGVDADDPEGSCTEDSQNPIAIFVTPSVDDAISDFAKEAKGLAKDGRRQLRLVNVEFKKCCKDISKRLKKGEITPSQAAAEARLKLLEGLADGVTTAQGFIDEIGTRATQALDKTGSFRNVPADLGRGGCGALDSAITTMSESLSQSNASLIKTFKKCIKKIGKAAKGQPSPYISLVLGDARADESFIHLNATRAEDLPRVLFWGACAVTRPEAGGGVACDTLLNGYANPRLGSVNLAVINASGRFELGTTSVSEIGFWQYQTPSSGVGSTQLFTCEQVGPSTCDVETLPIYTPGSCDVYSSCGD